MSRAAFEHKTAVYFGLEEPVATGKQPSLIRTVVALAVVVGTGVLLCLWGHAATGAPLIGVGVVMPFGSWYRWWETKRG